MALIHIPVAIRFFRQLLGLLDAFYVKHLMDKDIFGPILDILFSTMPRDNLLGSACLEFFEFIKKEKALKELVKHLVPKYREQFTELSGFETFRMMLLQYDQTQGFTAPTDFLLDSEEDTPRRPTGHTRMMEQLHVDPAEEEYWNGSDEEEEQAGAVSEKVPAANGASPATRQLVDYLSDGEDEEEMEGEQGAAGTPDTEKSVDRDEAEGDVKAEDAPPTSELTDATPDAQKSPGSSQVDGPSETSAADEAALEAARASAPTRLSEKRRREEDDDDDELGKMMQNKRRNSKGVSSNGTAQSLLKRKGSFTGGNGGAGKIAISISSAGLRSNEES